jgi:triosephosphate isomerase (TIM)
MSRRKIVAGNWKMNVMPSHTAELINSIIPACNNLQKHQLIIFCTPYTHFAHVPQAIPAQCKLGSQNVHHQASGAYTGEVSIAMQQDAGVQAIIIGHSERRQYNKEDNELLKAKLELVLAHNLIPIFCCGEPLEVRNAGQHVAYVLQQLKESVFHLPAGQMSKVVIAYEPIWAIGTGVTASSQQAQDMHEAIRAAIASHYNNDVAHEVSILYGGSCNAANAAELFAQADIDGGLIGGAALKADTFTPIIEAIKQY